MTIDIDTADIAANLENCDYTQLREIISALSPEAVGNLGYIHREHTKTIVHYSKADVEDLLDNLIDPDELEAVKDSTSYSSIVDETIEELGNLDDVHDYVNETINDVLVRLMYEAGVPQA